MRNIIQSFLHSLGIPYTKLFSEKLFEEHPNKNNMLGLSQMLKAYGLDMVGVRFVDKENAELPIPCILHIYGGFVVATKQEAGKIPYIWNDNPVTKEVSEFCQIWTGHALIADEKDFTKATEPDYRKNKRRETLMLIIKYIIAVGSVAVLIAGFIAYGSFLIIPLDIDFVFSSVGLIMSILLMQKQLLQTSRWGDKVCSFFHQTDCNNVLHTQYGEIGNLTWSEIGTGYFLARLICLSLLPETYFSISVFDWCAMAYLIWSLWIQAIVLRKYCTLCILVQVAVWVIGFADIYAVANGMIPLNKAVFPFILSGILILIAVFCVHCFSKIHFYTKELQEAKRKLRSFKSDFDIFEHKLKQGTKVDDRNCKSDILFGNEEARWQITILSNPHCNPCARMHERVESLLEKYGDSICVRYVFTSFSEDLEVSARFLISAYFQFGKDASRLIFKKWYSEGKSISKEYIGSFNVDQETEQVLEEMRKHNEWKALTGFTATPTIIVNGNELSDDYDIEDVIDIV